MRRLPSSVLRGTAAAAVVQRRSYKPRQQYRQRDNDAANFNARPATGKTSFPWPPPATPESQSPHQWRDMDTSFVDVMEVADFPTELDKPVLAIAAPAAAAGGGDAEPVPLGSRDDAVTHREAAATLRDLCEQYLTMDKNEYFTQHVSDSAVGPNYERFDMHMAPRRTWLTARSRFVEWRGTLFSLDAIKAGAVSVSELFDLLNWFAAAQVRANKDIQKAGFDVRPASDFLPLDLAPEVRCLLDGLAVAHTDPLVLFHDPRSPTEKASGRTGDTHFGLERLGSLVSLCRRFGVDFALPDGERAASAAAATTANASCLLACVADLDHCRGTPSQALALMLCALNGGQRRERTLMGGAAAAADDDGMSRSLRFSDPVTGAIASERDEKRLRGIALLCQMAGANALDNFDGDDLAQLLSFYVAVHEANAAYFATGSRLHQQQHRLPLSLYVSVALQRVRRHLYNKSHDRYVYSDTDYVPLREIEATTPTYHEGVIPNRFYHLCFGAEGMREAKVSVRASGQLLEILPAVARCFRQSELGVISVDSLTKDLLTHGSHRAMCNNTSGHVMRPNDALRLLRSTAEQIEKLEKGAAVHDAAGASSNRRQTLALVDMNVSVNANQISDPRTVAGFFDGFARCRCVPSALPKLEAAALRLLTHPAFGLAEAAQIATALRVIQAPSPVLLQHLCPIVLGAWATLLPRTAANSASVAGGGCSSSSAAETVAVALRDSVALLEAFASLSDADTFEGLLAYFMQTFVLPCLPPPSPLPPPLQPSPPSANGSVNAPPTALLQQAMQSAGAPVILGLLHLLAQKDKGDAGGEWFGRVVRYALSETAPQGLCSSLAHCLDLVKAAALALLNGGSAVGLPLGGGAGPFFDDLRRLLHRTATAVCAEGEGGFRQVVCKEVDGLREVVCEEGGGSVRQLSLDDTTDAFNATISIHRIVCMEKQAVAENTACLDVISALGDHLARLFGTAHSAAMTDIANARIKKEKKAGSQSCDLLSTADGDGEVFMRRLQVTNIDHAAIVEPALRVLAAFGEGGKPAAPRMEPPVAVRAAAEAAAKYCAVYVLLQEQALESQLADLAANHDGSTPAAASFEVVELMRRRLLAVAGHFADRVAVAVHAAGMTDVAEAAFAEAEDVFGTAVNSSAVQHGVPHGEVEASA